MLPFVCESTSCTCLVCERCRHAIRASYGTIASWSSCLRLADEKGNGWCLSAGRMDYFSGDVGELHLEFFNGFLSDLPDGFSSLLLAFRYNSCRRCAIVVVLLHVDRGV